MWSDINEHFEHQQCMKDAFGSAPLVISSTTGTVTSSTDTASNVTVATITPTSFLTINSKTERVLTHEESMFFNMIIISPCSPGSDELEICI